MPVNIVSEEKLRLALESYRVDPDKFEAAVIERLKRSEGSAIEPIAAMPPLLRTAASLLPLETLAAGQIAFTAAKSASVVGVFSKLVAYAAFPALALFGLLGSSILGATKIRRIQEESASGANSGGMDEQSFDARVKKWWDDRGWGVKLLSFSVPLLLSWYGATWVVFLAFIASTLILLYILKAFAKRGIGNRQIIGRSCQMGLAVLAQIGVWAGIADRDIHLVDQGMLTLVFLAGSLVVGLVSTGFKPEPFRDSVWGVRNAKALWRFILLVPFAAFLMHPILWSGTPERLRAYVESFDRAKFSSASWAEWETVASWLIESKPAPDLSRPRRLFAQEIADQENPVLPNIMNSALQVRLMTADQVRQIKFYEERRRDLLDQPGSSRIAVGFDDWVIRAAVLCDDLTPDQRDHLVERLQATLRWSLTPHPFERLEDPLSATELLAVIGRPVDPVQYREDVYALLKRLHHEQGGGFHRAGGFQSGENIHSGNLNATYSAIKLMEFYGIPKDLNLDWDRSFLRPTFTQLGSEKWISAATLARLNRLPGVKHPSWVESLYYERSFLAAAVLIVLCIYATVISPKSTGALNKESV